MKKAVKIISIEFNENKDVAKVLYETGTIRVYTKDKFPKTVQDYIKEHHDENESVEETGFILVDTPETGFVMVDAPAEQTTALVPVTMTTALVPVTKVEEPETAKETAAEAGTAEKVIKVAATVAKTAGKAIVKATKAVATIAPKIIEEAAKVTVQTAPVAGKATVKAMAWTLDKLISLYYLLTTWVPIGARWLAVHAVWTIQLGLPHILAGIRTIWMGATKSSRATWKGIKAAGIGTAHAASLVAGWVLVAILAAISLSIKTGKMVRDGWKLREEILEEQRA